MSARFLGDERLADLLVLEVTEGLDAAARKELETLLAAHPGASADALAPAAAAATLAGRLPVEPLPAELRATLIKQGETVVKVRTAAKVQPLPRRNPGPAPAAAPAAVVPGSGRYGWYAAAASLLIALAAWWPRLEAPAPTVVEAPTTAPAPNLFEAREALLAGAGPVVREEWSRTEDPASAAVTGDVVWDEATQTGYMRFSGLPANDPAEIQYQLWIFDGTRDDRFPVDGGVFDVPAGVTEVVVPIKATLPVRQAALFAVTVEQPGGVMVSSRERIVALAPVASG